MDFLVSDFFEGASNIYGQYNASLQDKRAYDIAKPQPVYVAPPAQTSTALDTKTSTALVSPSLFDDKRVLYGAGALGVVVLALVLRDYQLPRHGLRGRCPWSVSPAEKSPFRCWWW